MTAPMRPFRLLLGTAVVMAALSRAAVAQPSVPRATGGSAVRAAASSASSASSDSLREAREILREVININSSSGTKGVHQLATRIAARLRAAGFAAGDVQLRGPSPELTAVVVRLHGRASGRKPILLMAHMDVVPARRSDWPFDPFVMLERDGWYYGRGTSDNKAGVATLVTNLVRWKRERWVPDRDVITVLTADEETNGASMAWLLANVPMLREAEYALNTDAGGGALDHGKPVSNAVQAAEKVFANFRVVATNPGGHSSVPRADHAIYDLAEALARFRTHRFPIRVNEVVRGYFAQSAATQTPEVAALMRAAAAQPTDLAAAEQLAARNPYWNSIMRTTCVATLLDGGHAENALPQRASALINCRMLPADPADSVLAVLRSALGAGVTVAQEGVVTPSPASPLRADVMGVVEQLTAARFPGAVVVPEMSAGATDGLFTRNAGIPTYAVSSIFFEQGEPSREHGQEERVGIKAFHDGVAFWQSMVKALAGPPTIVP